jgi:uncharacterized protein (DUF736 family)
VSGDFDNTNRGALFKNNRKEQPNHPDYNGTINVNGVDYWLNGWLKESKKDGKKFFSLSVKEKGVNAPPRTPQAAETGAPDFDSEIPF